ncbi:DUF4932 domain-containing protein [Sphingobacterium oryzagri]|uniref:DUF4932 domain-containing protein n=1 Tax=Sphingobacterium oryzagri TaxID=3025669 RepID=A0ABY7WHX7_9SPHI|nr:DUF4932 domain-containing protein [Sphingobacterium sp. KACC 22765]WDF67110.1 DUF4932 domain-containing protein [Sphingobacterium sp. KACC 22765]WDF69211.1 DUF4932 domain-containing protein [Sphingobacterium sp. KACC 22765]
MNIRIQIAVTAVLLILSNHLFSQKKDVVFNKEYIERNDGKTTIEINESQELIYIILSLTDFAKENPNMVKHESSYYDSVQTHFSPFAELRVVKEFDKLLRESLVNYFLLSANAYGFKFDNNKLIPTNIYNFPGKGIGNYEIAVNPIITHLTGLEEFVTKSSYRKFYDDNQKYYDKLKAEYESYATVDEQKEWLENRFDYKINSYRILTSPLIAGMNATHTFTDEGFKEMLLFIPTIYKNNDWGEKYQNFMNVRIIFTEIDHNYVGPVSDRYLNRLNLIFSNRSKWVDISNKTVEHYPNALKVFDEYLTWGLFILYSYDKIKGDQDLFHKMVNHVNDRMILKGFPKALEFNQKLLDLYESGKYAKIEDLYTPLLDWCESQ